MADKEKKKKKFKEHDPEKYINLEPMIREARGSTVVMSFGRMNPITAGHEKMVNAVITEAVRRKATPMIFMSHSRDAKKNPLSYNDKLNYARKAFGRVVVKSNSKTIIDIAKELSKRFSHIVMVVGSDRAKEFETLLNKYNGKDYKFEKIEVVSAGMRDPDSEGVEGISGSKMRSYAQNSDFENFKKSLPKKLKSSAEEVYDAVRNGMNLSEEFLEERAVLSVSQRRRRGMVMKRYKTKIAAARKRARKRRASPEKLKMRAQKKALAIIKKRLSKNKKYDEMSPTEKIALDKRLMRVSKSVINRIAKRELPKVRRAESERLASLNKKESFVFESEDPDVGHMKGSQPKGYYKGVAKSVKADRARHFAKHAKMDDNNPAAYKPAPGDSTAKTKTSKHTKKFKQMFGEASCADTKVRKRPHMGLNKNGSAKIDKRFKIFKKKMNEDYDDPVEDLANLMLDMDNFMMSEEFDILMESDSKEALKKKAEKSGISYGILKKVFDRGVAAWRTGHRPGTTPTQWGLARVNSFATKSKGTWGKADKDLAAKVRIEEVEIFTLDEQFEMQFLDEASILDKALAAIHKYVSQGTELTDIAYQVSRAAGVNKTSRELEKAYVNKYGKPNKKSVGSGSALKKKYGFAENAATDAVKARIKAEKERDARKHDRMLDAAKMKDLSKKLKSEGSKDPSDREWGTDSLTKTYKKDTPGEDLKEQSPYMKDLPRGSRVRFSVQKITGEDYDDEGTVVGTDADTLRLRIRDDSGQLHIVKHEDAEKIG